MGTDCAPFLANLFLYSYEFQWIDKQRILKEFDVLKLFQCCGRYIDDLIVINNFESMTKAMTNMYPKELVLVPDNTNGLSAPFLDLQLTISDGVIHTSIYDKRDHFDFPIVNFPDLSGNIPIKSAYGVFIGELVRYARACTFLDDFNSRTLLLVNKIKKQGFTTKKLKQTYLKFCEAHFFLIQNFGFRF